MGSPKQIVIIDANLFTREALQTILQTLPEVAVQVVETADDAALAEVVKLDPQVVILNLYPDAESLLGFAGRLNQVLREGTLVVTASAMESDLIRRAMRQGAREFLPQPFNHEEVRAALESVLSLQKAVPRNQTHAGQVITFFGAKGGVGATTLTTNLAVSLAKEFKQEVIVLDLNLQFGNDALFLNLKSKYSIFDVAKNINDLDTDLLKKTLPHHATGVTLLPSPFRLEDAESINGSHVVRIIQLLRAHYDWILIDSHPYFNEVSIQALDDSDKILLLSVLDLPTIFNTKRCLELFQKMGYSREKVQLVLNRYLSYEGADLPEMEQLLQYPIFARIPNQDFNSMVGCVNQGIPITLKMPNSKLSLAIGEMMYLLAGRVNGGEHASNSKSGLFGLWKK